MTEYTTTKALMYEAIYFGLEDIKDANDCLKYRLLSSFVSEMPKDKPIFQGCYWKNTPLANFIIDPICDGNALKFREILADAIMEEHKEILNGLFEEMHYHYSNRLQELQSAINPPPKKNKTNRVGKLAS